MYNQHGIQFTKAYAQHLLAGNHVLNAEGRANLLLNSKSGDEFIKLVAGSQNSPALCPEFPLYLLNPSTKLFTPAVQDDTLFSNAMWPRIEFDRTASTAYLLHALMAAAVVTGNESAFPKLSSSKFTEFQKLALGYYGNDKAQEIDFSQGPVSIGREVIDLEKFDTFIALTAIHDLCKSQHFMFLLEYSGVKLHADHDDNILEVMKTEELWPLIPSFERKSLAEKQDIIAVFGTGHNMGRTAQLEGTPAGMAGARGQTLIQERLNALHYATDVAGVMGNIAPRHSLLWDETLHTNMFVVFEQTARVVRGTHVVDAYNEVLSHRAKEFGLDANDHSIGRPATRLCAMMRKIADPALVTNYLKSISAEEWGQNLIRELNETGYNGRPAIQIGFAPDIFNNIHQSTSDDPKARDTAKALDLWCRFMNKTMQKVRLETRGKNLESFGIQNNEGQIGIEVDGLLGVAKSKPETLALGGFSISVKGKQFKASPENQIQK
jgi:hypothetical protein